MRTLWASVFYNEIIVPLDTWSFSHLSIFIVLWAAHVYVLWWIYISEKKWMSDDRVKTNRWSKTRLQNIKIKGVGVPGFIVTSQLSWGTEVFSICYQSRRQFSRQWTYSLELILNELILYCNMFGTWKAHNLPWAKINLSKTKLRNCVIPRNVQLPFLPQVGKNRKMLTILFTWLQIQHVLNYPYE